MKQEVKQSVNIHIGDKSVKKKRKYRRKTTQAKPSSSSSYSMVSHPVFVPVYQNQPPSFSNHLLSNELKAHLERLSNENKEHINQVVKNNRFHIQEDPFVFDEPKKIEKNLFQSPTPSILSSEDYNKPIRTIPRKKTLQHNFTNPLIPYSQEEMGEDTMFPSSHLEVEDDTPSEGYSNFKKMKKKELETYAIERGILNSKDAKKMTKKDLKERITNFKNG